MLIAFILLTGCKEQQVSEAESEATESVSIQDEIAAELAEADSDLGTVSAGFEGQ